VGKIAEKSSLQECIFDNMALYFQTVVFWAILPTGIIVITENGTSKKENISAVINHVGALGIDHYKTLLDHGYIIL